MAEPTKIASYCMLDTWASLDWTQGVQIESLEDFTEIRVYTRNNLYEITVIDATAREVLVRGGEFFPVRTPARIGGASLGGSFIKVGGIYAGFKLELVDMKNQRTIITSTVQTVSLYSAQRP
jgi:hypothetical protein